jgi:LPXTG-motif cell wall-anchored protein
MPHAWADEADDNRTTSANHFGFTLAGLAIAGAVAALGYLVFRRK